MIQRILQIVDHAHRQWILLHTIVEIAHGTFEVMAPKEGVINLLEEDGERGGRMHGGWKQVERRRRKRGHGEIREGRRGKRGQGKIREGRSE